MPKINWELSPSFLRLGELMHDDVFYYIDTGGKDLYWILDYHQALNLETGEIIDLNHPENDLRAVQKVEIEINIVKKI